MARRCLQENPNAIPEGETPHNVTLLCYDPLVDVTKPGDRITVTGVTDFDSLSLEQLHQRCAMNAVTNAAARILLHHAPLECAIH